MKKGHMTCYLFLVFLSSAKALTLLYDTTDNYWEIQEGKQDNTFTCTGLSPQSTALWYLKDPSLPNGLTQVGSCPPLLSNGSQPVCEMKIYPIFKPSRISSDTSVMVVNTTATTTTVLFAYDRLVCSELESPGGSVGSRLDYIYSSENVTCIVQVRNETWTVFGQCEIKKTYSEQRRFRCEWMMTKESSILMASVSMTVVSSVGKYFNGSCNFTSYLPPDGQYTYRVTVVPGEVTVNATFIGNNTIRRPSSTPFHNCPQYVLEGSNLTCTCSVSDLGNPTGALQWNSSQSKQLRLAGLQAGYSQTHVCQLMWNNTVVQSVEYKVNVAFGPNNVTAAVLGPQPFDTNGLQSINITCLVSGSSPPANITWVRSRDQSIVCNSPMCVLTPKPPDDDGVSLECRARNLITTKTSSNSVTVTLNYPPTLPPAITANPELPDTQPVYQGDNMTLRCTVSGGKPVNATVIAFTCPGKTDMSVVTIGTSNITSSLMILPVSSDNHGRCVCSARWKKTDWYNQTISWNINVYTPPSIPVIFPLGDTTGRPAYPFMVGTSGILRCQSNQTGRPEATYSWPVPSTGQASGSNLTFYNLSREDNGRTVKCRASNDYTENRWPVDDATLVLQVYYEPVVSFTRFSDGNDCVEVSSLSDYKQCVVAEGQRIHINCTADSNPSPLSFKWLSQNKDVYSNSSELLITSANHTIHNGDYNCTVVTKQANNDSRLPLTSFAILTVIVGYSPSVLNFSINNVDNMTVNVQEKSRVDMQCLCDGRPAPSIRLINVSNPEQLLSQSQSTEDIFANEQSSKVNFSIEQVPCEASGVYRCDGNNSLGQDSRSRTLLVYCAPRGIFGDENVNISSGELTIRMTAYPTPVVKKIIFLGHNESSDGEPVKENNIPVQCLGSFLSPAAVTCNIKMILTANNNEGFYRIVFSNSLGDLPFTFFVKDNKNQENGQEQGPNIPAIIGGSFAALIIVVGIIVTAFLVQRYRRNGGQQRSRSNDPPNINQQKTTDEGGTALYEGLKLDNVGERSQYEELQRYQNASAISPPKTSPLYEALQVQDVGKRSDYEELQRYQNISAISQ